MDSLRDTNRQIRLAIAAILTVTLIGVIGYVVIEGMSVIDAIWLTIITLTTIGYGDVLPQTIGGHIFTLFLIFFGLGSVAFGLQAFASFLLSPTIRINRQRRTVLRAIQRLHNHYIICGSGELVEYTVKYLVESAAERQRRQQEIFYQPVDRFLDRLLGDDQSGHHIRIHRFFRVIFHSALRLLKRPSSLLDVIVIVTPDAQFADRLRERKLLALDGDSGSDEILLKAGVERASVLVAMLDTDTETLLTVLTARNLNANINIIAAPLDEMLGDKMVNLGATNVIPPYEIAAQFLNSATLRPAVNEFMNRIIFTQHKATQTSQIHLHHGSTWVGQSLEALQLQHHYDALVIGIRVANNQFLIVPPAHTILQEGWGLIILAAGKSIPRLHEAAQTWRESGRHTPTYISASATRAPQSAQSTLTLEAAALAIQDMREHYIICGTGLTARHAISKLDPNRPFVLMSDNAEYTAELLAKGFRVVHGNLAHETNLHAAGADRALAIMIAIDDGADCLLAVVNARSLSQRILITTLAHADELAPKLKRAGADRVVGPLQTAAQFVILAATRPAVSDFLQHIIYNYAAQIETTELYMQNDSPWIGQKITTLNLWETYQARVLSIRLADGQHEYVPHDDRQIARNEVLIIVTPMRHADQLRNLAHGSQTKRPASLRRVIPSKS